MPDRSTALRQVLAGRVPPVEIEALATAKVFTFEQRVVITLTALGDTHDRASESLHLPPNRLAHLLRTVSHHLRCPNRVPAIAQAAYQAPAFPLPIPGPEDGPPPALTPREWALLWRRARGMTLREVKAEQGIPAAQLRQVDESLVAKLGADNRTHTIRRAWQLELFARPLTVPSQYPAGHSEVARVLRELGAR
ncbi:MULTISPECIES: helix-turn-helix transcriptional regulator [Streptomyces]|uniref:helix-turn-helix transcriptional regulator n=1 Tax=Streptomyces TaxID=1883 RepID=UPI00163D00F0|nr:MULTISPECIES: response regulator transcription factor [Streptomyces]MBC2879314.1 response regulator transcription factor [Streptomyces sp. TYQ1024]UBI40086.1 hypothetical protein K7I03_28935 [Streptomyces mobaraensis]UKW32665.1 hypothetical protein MCU78_28865 [Streptomyces sp. TYQ1024]